MSWLKTIAAELYGLFVDDGSFALALIAWLLAIWLLISRLDLFGHWQGLVLFIGLAGILAASAIWRSSR